MTAKALREHLLGSVLPFWRDHGWRDHGVDRTRGGFVSRLAADGRPADDRERRLLVQTRQLYVFSAGHELGAGAWSLELAEAGFAHLVSVWHDSRHGGFFHTATRDGEPLDRRKDSYDHAFVVFGLAHHHRASANPRAVELAVETWQHCRSALADPEGGGYFEAADADWTPRRAGPRRQNPHMHWVEALLALHQETGDAQLLDDALGLVELAARRFVDAEHGCLLEMFGTDWSPLAAPDENWAEPGHHYEWAWLLDRFQRAHGDDAATRSWSERLFHFAETHGLDADGGVFDRVAPGGQTLADTKRLWPQTERLKALAARGDRPRLERAVAACLERYATASGGWHEHLDRAGVPRTKLHNATSVYHVVAALREVIPALEGS